MSDMPVHSITVTTPRPIPLPAEGIPEEGSKRTDGETVEASPESSALEMAKDEIVKDKATRAEDPKPVSDLKADARKLEKDVIKPPEARTEIPLPAVHAKPAPERTREFVKVATLHVGDHFAKGYNSDITYRASKGAIRPTASYRLPPDEPIALRREPLPPPPAPSNSVTPARTFSGDGPAPSFGKPWYMNEFNRTPIPISPYRFAESAEKLLATRPQPRTAPPPEPPRNRFIKLVAYDVHATQGADPSHILILDKAGMPVRTVMLPRGQSEKIIELAAGECTIIARAGRTGPRGDGMSDEYDNFRLEIFEATASGDSEEGGDERQKKEHT